MEIIKGILRVIFGILKMFGLIGKFDPDWLKKTDSKAEMTTLHKNHKSCGTCDYWAGPRKVDRSPGYVLVEGNNPSGTCSHPKGNRLATKNAKTSGCPDLYQQWGAIS